MYTAYLLILTAFSGAGEIVDPAQHKSLDSCMNELQIMKEAVTREWSEHGILRMKGECRPLEQTHPVYSESTLE